MDRKQFLLKSTLTAIAMTTFGSVVKGTKGKFTGDCGTTNDILGPFYRADAPERSNLMFDGLIGTKIEVKGKVYKSDCVSLFPNVQVEIWHCNTKGEYDNESKEFNHRGRIFTNENGEYSFQTIIPGKYLNGQLYRPSHIHFRVTEKNSKELISQIYFEGDPHITKDPWASQEKAQLRILPFINEDINGNLIVLFDIYLKDK